VTFTGILMLSNMHPVKKLLFLGASLFCPQLQHIQAQVADYNNFEKRKEIAIAELKNFPKADTNRVSALVNIFGMAMFLKQKEEVMPYCMEAFAISRKINYAKGLAHCYLNMGFFYKSSLDHRKAQIYLDSVIYVAANSQDRKILELKAQACQSKGQIYYEEENYYPALNYFLEAIKYAEFSPRRRVMMQNTFITEIYMALNNLEKAEEYAQKNIALSEKDTNAIADATAYFPFIDICITKNDLPLAISYLDKISKIMPDPKEILVNFGYYNRRGRVNYQQKNYKSALMYYQLAYKYAQMSGHKSSIGTALGFLSETSLKLGNREDAKNYALQSLALSTEENTKTGKVDALLNLSEYYNTTDNTKDAFTTLQQAMRLKDSLVTETNVKQINLLGAFYEFEKQQNEISRLQNEKAIQAVSVKQKSVLNKVFVASILGLLVLGYLGYSNFKKRQQLAKHQQELQNQKIIDLEKNKQLLTVEAMVKGQEEERSRIAKDLHDGLGSLLSGAKLSFINVQETLQLPDLGKASYEKSLSLLDNAIVDLRKVAQNLMPEAMAKFGLHEALKDFINSIQTSSAAKIVYQQFGEQRKFDSMAEIFIYRIIQELVNNALKHANSSQIIVQLIISSRKVEIAVEDNGKGFDKENLAFTKGAGMANIRYRVQYFNGIYDIITAPGKGTSVNIELIA
jgi:two-component system, NarL family, sensor kinase